MSSTTSGLTGVQESLDALQAERNAEWPPARLHSHAELRRSLERNADRAGFVKPGDQVLPFSLPGVDGGTVDLEQLLKSGPVVLLFFRFEGCPACNAALPAYDRTLAPALRELGAHLVAISPQVPERLAAIKERHDLSFRVAADAHATLLRRFGIAFEPDDAGRQAARDSGHDLGEILGTGGWELPYPSVVVIGRDRVVAFADVHPDWMVRTEAAPVIEAVRALAAAT